MFICETCLDKFEGPAIENAKFLIGFTGSYGPCEICKKTSVCSDVPSSANWTRKKTADDPQ